MSTGMQNGMECSRFEALMAEALDGTLEQRELAAFEAHAAACPDCGPMLAHARLGLRFLSALEEVEPPRHLVHNILAATSGAAPAAQPDRRPWRDVLTGWFRPVAVPVYATVRQPRFAMSFAMVFFSLSMVLSLTGVRLRDLGRLDLRPSAIRRSLVRGYNDTTASVVRYYENMRLVYELQSRVRDLRQATQPQEPAPAPRGNDNTTQKPEEHNQRYTRDSNDAIVASHQFHHSILIADRRDA